MQTRTIGALLGGLVVGTVGTALLYNYPKGEVTKQTYCVECAAIRYESRENVALGAQSSGGTKSGTLTAIVGDLPPHEHRWAEPMAYVFPTYPQPTLTPQEQLHDKLVKERLSAIEELERNPGSVATLFEAVHEDRARTTAFVKRLLDPNNPLPISVVRFLGGTRPWAERFADVDALLAAYACDATDVKVSCHIKVKGHDETVLERTPTGGSLDTGPIDRWHAARHASD